MPEGKQGLAGSKSKSETGVRSITSARSMCCEQAVHLLQVSAYPSTTLEQLRPRTIKKSAKTLKKKERLLKSVLVLQKVASLSHYSQNDLGFS